MPIVAKANGENFILCPAGAHASVCVDVVDLGIVETEFAGEKKKQHKVRIVWQTEDAQDNGKPFTAQKRYTLSLHEKAALRKDLESWRGRQFTPQELEGFDLERLIGVGAFINVIHEQRNGKTYDNVASIMKLPRNVSAPEPQGYVRVCDRQQQAAPAPAYDIETYVPSDDDVPFS
jgi:hypothetical protein